MRIIFSKFLGLLSGPIDECCPCKFHGIPRFKILAMVLFLLFLSLIDSICNLLPAVKPQIEAQDLYSTTGLKGCVSIWASASIWAMRLCLIGKFRRFIQYIFDQYKTRCKKFITFKKDFLQVLTCNCVQLIVGINEWDTILIKIRKFNFQSHAINMIEICSNSTS